MPTTETITTLDAACAALIAAGYEPAAANDERLILALTDPGDDDDAATAALDEIRTIVGPRFAIGWTGDGTTDSSGYSTADAWIAVAVSLIDQLRAAIDAAATAERAYRAYMADDSDPDDRCNTADATNAADAEVERLRAAVIAAGEERGWEVLIDGGQGGDCEITACSLEDAVEQAADWTRDGDWDTSGGTLYCDVSVRCELTGEQSKTTVAIEQDEPECTGSEHDWQSPHEIVGGIEENPGVQGHGGGVIIEEVCMHCGCARTTDTWAQRWDTGEQGLREVTYEPGKYADQIAAPEEHVHCECGEALGERCEWSGPRSQTVVVEWMPRWLRESHRQARNCGSYPHNGALRLRVERNCAERLSADDASDGASETVAGEG